MPKKETNSLKHWLKLYKSQLAAGLLMVGLAGGLAGGYLWHQAEVNTQETNETSKINLAKNKHLKAEYKRLKAVKPVSKAEGTLNLKNAVQAGNKLADLQNQYAKAGTNDQKIEKIVKQIRPLLLSKNDEPSPWFETGNKKVESKWIFTSKFTFTQQSVDVVFENVTKDNKLLAYTIATYLPDKMQFTDIKTTVTTLGYNATNSTGKDQASAKKQLDRQVDSIHSFLAKSEKGKKIKGFTKKQQEAREKADRELNKENAKNGGYDKDLPDDMRKNLHLNKGDDK